MDKTIFVFGFSRTGLLGAHDDGRAVGIFAIGWFSDCVVVDLFGRLEVTKGGDMEEGIGKTRCGRVWSDMGTDPMTTRQCVLEQGHSSECQPAGGFISATMREVVALSVSGVGGTLTVDDQPMREVVERVAKLEDRERGNDASFNRIVKRVSNLECTAHAAVDVRSVVREELEIIVARMDGHSQRIAQLESGPRFTINQAFKDPSHALAEGGGRARASSGASQTLDDALADVLRKERDEARGKLEACEQELKIVRGTSQHRIADLERALEVLKRDHQTTVQANVELLKHRNDARAQLEEEKAFCNKAVHVAHSQGVLDVIQFLCGPCNRFEFELKDGHVRVDFDKLASAIKARFFKDGEGQP